MKRNLFLATLSAALIFGIAPLTLSSVRAQDIPTPAASAPDDIDMGESSPAIKELKSISPKTIIFVFDISGSMRGELLRRAREATINILREGTQAGDRVVLYTFGSDYNQVFDKTLTSEAEKRELIDEVPNKPGEGAGTNIRKPHHEALKLLEENLPKPGAVILLTDSFNDEPKKDDPSYSTYLKYYLPGGRLTKYPDTPENRDYERLLREMSRSQKVKIFGIGVQIDSSGRPVEPLPLAEPSPTVETGTVTTPVTVAPVSEAKPGGLPLPYLLGGGVLLAAVIAGLMYYLQGSKPIPLRILGGPGGPKNFDLRPGQSLSLGGGSAYAFDAYALPDLKGAAALIRGGSGGKMTVGLSPVQAPGTIPAKVFHNGLPLEKEAPLSYGDEVRIAVPDASGVGIQKEYRLKFDDPTKSF